MSLAMEKSPVKKKAKAKPTPIDQPEPEYPIEHVKDRFGNHYTVQRTFHGLLGSPIWKPEKEEEEVEAGEDLENVDTLEIDEAVVEYYKSIGEWSPHRDSYIPHIPSGGQPKLMEAAGNPGEPPKKRKRKKKKKKTVPVKEEKKPAAVDTERTVVTRDNNPYVNPFNIDEYVESEKICMCCERYPCVMDEHLEDVQERIGQLKLEVEEGNLKNNQARFLLYRFTTTLLHGYLGKGVRRQLPWCVNSAIQNAFPARNGSYTGFKQSNDYSAHEDE